MKKILFIAHDTSRTGAPMIMLHFIKWLKKNHPEFLVDILALKRGELEEDFKRIGDQFILKPQVSNLLKLERKIKTSLGFEDSDTAWLKKIAKKKYHIIYANTVSSIPVASKLLNYNDSKLIWHIHELETVIQLLLNDFDKYKNEVSFYIAASNLVRYNLIENHLVPAELIKTIYEFSPMELREEKIGENKIFKVGASGTLHWRKGADIFLQVCRYINKHYPDLLIEFEWVGALPVMEKLIIDQDIKKLGLEDKISFTGPTDKPYKYYRNFDVFLLTSREDPFPLVCIEVGRMGIPIVCFEGATGTTEILKDGGGTIVPYLSIEDMAEQIVKYYTNSELRCLHGKESKDLFSKFTPAEICPQIYDSLRVYLK